MTISILSKKNLLSFSLITMFALVLLIYEVTHVATPDEITYQEDYTFDKQKVFDSLTENETRLFDEYKNSGLQVAIEPKLLKFSNIEGYKTKSRQAHLIDFVYETYGLNVQISEYTDIDVDLHITAENMIDSDFIYNPNLSVFSTIGAFSQSPIDRNLHEQILSGREIEVICNEDTWNYLLHTLGELDNLTLADTSGDGIGDLDDIINEEDRLFEYLENPLYADKVILALNTNLYFDYMYDKDILLDEVDYYYSRFDIQYTYIGASDDDSYSLSSKLFSTEWAQEFEKYVARKTYPQIIDNMIEESILNQDSKFEQYISELDVINVGLFSPYFPYAYKINGQYEGYHVELFESFENILSTYNIEVKLSDLTSGDYPYQDDFVYTNFYDVLHRDEDYIYSAYYDSNQYQIISKNDINNYSSLTQITGKIAVPYYLNEYGYLLDVLDDDDIVECGSPNDCKSLLDNGTAEYMFISTSNYSYYSYFSSDYHISLATLDVYFDGYFAVNNFDKNAEYLVEFINLLFLTVNYEELYSSVSVTFDNYVNLYNAQTTDSSQVIIILVTYFVLLLVISTSIIVESKKKQSSINKQFNDLVKVSNIGMLSIILNTNIDTFDPKYGTTNNVIIYLNYNMIKSLEISNYTYDEIRNLFSVPNYDFMRTMISFIKRDGTKAKFQNVTSNIETKMLYISKQREITVEHRTVKSKTPIFYKYTISKVDKREDYALSALAVDNTSIYKQYELLSDIAFKDNLTGLNNVRKLQEDVKRNSFKYYVTLNVHNFKFYNESYSPQFADKILVKIAENIISSIGANDRAYRVVADNFLIFTSQDETIKVERLLSKIISQSEELEVENYDEPINVSLYYAISEFDSSKYKDFSQFSNESNIKSFLGKQRKGFYVEDKDYENVTFLRELQAEIFKLKNFNDFEIYLQPKVNPFTEKCIGAEALIRWKHKRHGMISPCDFIPRFERLGKIGSLDEFVLNETCKALVEFQKNNLVNNDFVLSFNLSGHSVLKKDFSETIKSIIERHNVDYNNIEIEVLESIDLQKHNNVIEQFKELYELGIHIAIDDYGSGYSNVYTVTALPFTKLKFDKSILDNIDTDPEKCKLFTDLVKMHSALGHSILVEGVEKQEQVDIVMKEGVTEIQGYFYSKPLSFTDFKQYIIKHK